MGCALFLYHVNRDSSPPTGNDRFPWQKARDLIQLQTNTVERGYREAFMS